MFVFVIDKSTAHTLNFFVPFVFKALNFQSGFPIKPGTRSLMVLAFSNS